VTSTPKEAQVHRIFLIERKDSIIRLSDVSVGGQGRSILEVESSQNANSDCSADTKKQSADF
jgi:hypothetical protein